ncbi:MAG: hypothetical protein DWQ01_09575 [Planctomycetota bacterium]|nr:MAG: hypothetical protein DWQ01_09575 [Planctomycetota bacterium]
MASHTNTLARFLLNQWRNTQGIAQHLYDNPLDEKKLRAARQALSRLREAVKHERWPIEVPAGKALVLDERWGRKAEGSGSEKCFRLRILDRQESPVARRDGANYVQLWFQPNSWSGWIVPGFATLERDRCISHKNLYTAHRGPDNWLNVASNEVYREVNAAAGDAAYGELYGPAANGWAGSGDLVYIGLGTGSGFADMRVLRELLEENKSRCIRAVVLDFSPVLLSVAVANIYQGFQEQVRSGRLNVIPILGDLERPEEWAQLLPSIEAGTSLVVGMFGNTIGHLQYRERQTLGRILDGLDDWARRHRAPRWSHENSRFLLGISIQRKEGAPHGRDSVTVQRWLNFVADPLRDLLETAEGEYEAVALGHTDWERVEGRNSIAQLRHRHRGRSGEVMGRVWHEELPYKPSDGITGVVQRYFFAFERSLDLDAKQVFSRHHLSEAFWQHLENLTAHFDAGLDQVVLCEVTQFNLKTFRPALRRMGVIHGDSQVYKAKVGNTEPYAVLAFARN